MTDSDKNRAVPVSAEELDALRRDAARYRWLRYKIGSEEVKNITHGRYRRGVALDAAIDDAMVKP